MPVRCCCRRTVVTAPPALTSVDPDTIQAPCPNADTGEYPPPEVVPLTITGEHLTPLTRVTIGYPDPLGPTQVAPPSTVSSDGTSLLVDGYTLPVDDEGAPVTGTFDVTVTNQGGTDTLTAALTITPCQLDPLTLTGVDPAETAAGNTVQLTLTGTGFLAPMTVTIGGTPAASVTVVDDTTLTVSWTAPEVDVDTDYDVSVTRTLDGATAGPVTVTATVPEPVAPAGTLGGGCFPTSQPTALGDPQYAQEGSALTVTVEADVQMYPATVTWPDDSTATLDGPSDNTASWTVPADVSGTVTVTNAAGSVSSDVEAWYPFELVGADVPDPDVHGDPRTLLVDTTGGASGVPGLDDAIGVRLSWADPNLVPDPGFADPAQNAIRFPAAWAQPVDGKATIPANSDSYRIWLCGNQIAAPSTAPPANPAPANGAIPVVAGQVLHLEGTVSASVNNREIRWQLSKYNAAGNFTSTTFTGNDTPVPGPNVDKRFVSDYTVPADGTAYLAIAFTVESGFGGTVTFSDPVVNFPGLTRQAVLIDEPGAIPLNSGEAEVNTEIDWTGGTPSDTPLQLEVYVNPDNATAVALAASGCLDVPADVVQIPWEPLDPNNFLSIISPMNDGTISSVVGANGGQFVAIKGVSTTAGAIDGIALTVSPSGALTVTDMTPSQGGSGVWQTPASIPASTPDGTEITITATDLAGNTDTAVTTVDRTAAMNFDFTMEFPQDDGSYRSSFAAAGRSEPYVSTGPIGTQVAVHSTASPSGTVVDKSVSTDAGGCWNSGSTTWGVVGDTVTITATHDGEIRTATFTIVVAAERTDD